MSTSELPHARSEASVNTSAFRVCLSISGLRCASEGAVLERALRRIVGVRDATVNALREKLAVEVDALTRVHTIIETLAKRGYPVGDGEIGITTWIGGSYRRLADLRRELLGLPGVNYCGIALATGRLELRVAMDEGWQPLLRGICRRVCGAGEPRKTRANPILAGRETDGYLEEAGSDQAKE